MAIATPQSYASAGVTPDEIFNFGNIDTSNLLGTESVAGLLGNADYGDATYYATSEVYPLVDVNLLDADKGGRGVYIGASNDGLYLESGDHPVAAGAFTIVKWFSFPNEPSLLSSASIEGLVGAHIDSSNYLHLAHAGVDKWGAIGFTGGIGVGTIGNENERLSYRHAQDSMNLNMCAIVRDSSGDISDYLNGKLTSVPSNFPNNLSTGTLRLGSGNPFAIHIEAAIFERALTESELNAIYNRGQGTFGGIS